MKILLAGLDAASAGMAGQWLREGGHDVTSCGPGEERLVSNRWQPEVIVMRAASPGALTQFVGWLRARHRLGTTRVIAVLGGEGSDAWEWVKAGAAEVLASPIARADLVARLAMLGAEGGARGQLEQAKGEAARAKAELESARRAAQEEKEVAAEAGRERDRLADELRRVSGDAERQAARLSEVEKALDEARGKLEKALGDLAAETKRAAGLTEGAARAALLEKELDDLRGVLADLKEKHQASVARAPADGAVAEALDKARSELRALRVEFDEAQRLPVRLLEAIGTALAEGVILLERAAPGKEPTVVYANPGTERLTGRKRSEMTGNPLWFSASDAEFDWDSREPALFHREEPKEGGGNRRLKVEVLPVRGVAGGRMLWAMVFSEQVAEILVRAQGPSLSARLLTTPMPSAGGAPARRVLLARDAGQVNPRLAGVFRDAGFQVSTAEPGSGVMEKIHEGDFDLAVVEINRPGPSGPGMLRVMRQRLPKQRVLVVSRLLTLRQKQEIGRLEIPEIVTEELSGPELLQRAEAALG